MMPTRTKHVTSFLLRGGLLLVVVGLWAGIPRLSAEEGQHRGEATTAFARALGIAETGDGEGSVHPQDAFIPHFEEAVPVSRERRDSEIAQRLLGAKAVQSFGVLEGTEEEMIGAVQDVRLHDGFVFVLDERYKQVRVYDVQNGLQTTFGRSGAGPEAFGMPLSMDVDAAGRVYVLDQGNQAYKTFVPEGRSYVPESTTTVGVLSGHVCALGDELLLRGVIPSKFGEGTVYVYDSGAYQSAFGSRYASKNEYINMRLSEGPMDCRIVGGEGRLVSGYLGLPIIEVYDGGRQRLRTFRFEDFDPVRVTDQGNGKTLFEAGHADVTSTRWVTLLPDGIVLAQVAERWRDTHLTKRPYHEVHSYLLYPKTGDFEYLGTELPPVYDVSDTHVVAGTNAPYPKVTVFELGAAAAE